MRWDAINYYYYYHYSLRIEENQLTILHSLTVIRSIFITVACTSARLSVSSSELELD